MINNLAKALHKNESPKPSTVTVTANDIRNRMPSATGEESHMTEDDVIMSTIPSKRVFGIGIIAIGLLVLSIALILGFQFPKHVFEKTIDHLCVLSSAHPEYREWVNDTYRTHLNRIFYWNLTNPGVFLAGGEPQFQEVGPYVYRQYSNKFNVDFAGASVEFYDTATQEFDVALTKHECDQCKQYDMITSFNPFYLKNVGKCGGLQNYLTWKLSYVLKTILSLLWDTYTEDIVYRELGKLDKSLVDVIYANTYPSNFNALGYGGWLVSLNKNYVNTILQRLSSNKSFTVIQMRGLYDALVMDSDLDCETYLSTSKCAEALHTSHATQNDTTQICTFHNCLTLAYDYYNNRNNLHLAPVCLFERLCLKNNSCFEIQENETRAAFVASVQDYVSNLLQYVHHVSVILNDNDLIATRSQDTWSRGYKHNASLSDGVAHVPGNLPHVDWSRPISSQVPKVTLSNCYEAVDAASNFHWRAYGGHRILPVTYFPLTSSEERQVGSMYLNLAPTRDLGACAYYGSRLTHLETFVPVFLRRIPFFAYRNTSLNGITVEQFLLNRSVLAVDEKFVLRQGLQEMHSATGFCNWLSLPHLLYADSTRNSYYPKIMNPKSTLHASTLSVEAITGEVWQRTIRYQQNIGLPKSYVTVSSSSSSSCTNELTPYPVYWVDSTSTYNERGLNHYNFHVRRLMNASCGGLIGVSILGTIIIILGFLAATVRIRSGRIVPIKDDSF